MTKSAFCLTFIACALTLLCVAADDDSKEIPPDFLNPSGYPGLVKYWRGVLDKEIEVKGIKDMELRTFASVIARKGDFGVETALEVGLSEIRMTIPNGKVTVRQALWMAKLATGLSFNFSKDGTIIRVVN